MAIGEWQVEREERRTWIDFLKDEDLVFAKRFLLASGSLKALAQAYGVTYPTIRLRLDRLIQKINLVEDERIDSEFERLARVQYAEGKIDLDTLKLLLNAHRKELEKRHENPAVR
ncbi:MAG: DUF2089 domain-containing protein [Rhodopirellula sp.]|nr:DUF2089 domain-containing protein [Rhodopirellula sp.]